MLLSILIPTIKKHSRLFKLLEQSLISQMFSYSGQVELLSDDHETDSIGTKRNRLLGRVKGKYSCFIDSDDRVSINYISLLMEGLKNDVDCCSLKGIISTNGEDRQYFEHSIMYNEYRTNKDASFELGQIKYERFPNHLSCIKSGIAKQFKFPETNWGEDTDWATQIHKSGLLRNEYFIEEVLYLYDYITNKQQYEL